MEGPNARMYIYLPVRQPKWSNSLISVKLRAFSGFQRVEQRAKENQDAGKTQKKENRIVHLLGPSLSGEVLDGQDQGLLTWTPASSAQDLGTFKTLADAVI
eukprot:1972369-Rhodomonas_salina.1